MLRDWIYDDASPNPRARYRSEKGPPVKKDSAWLDVDTGDRISNTFWPAGYVDYTGREPDVWLDDPQIDEATWKASRPRGGGRLVTYLLHPDKWARHSGSFRSARDFIPNVSLAPSQPIGYALKIVYQTPVKLSSKPELPQNPRAWFESFGEATGCKKVGEVKIHATGKIKPVYAKIVIHAPGRGPRGAGCVPILRAK